MTNAQKWVAAFLVLFLLLFALSRIVKKDDVIHGDIQNFDESSFQGESSQEEDGLTLITKAGCSACHGGDLKGSVKAPSLISVKEYWSRDNLINYLRNPADYSGDKRFEQYKAKYNSIMPSYSRYDVQSLGKMADYLLNLEE